MHLDLDLALFAAEYDHVRYAGNTEEPRSHRPLGHRAQVHQRPRRRREPRHQHRAGGRRERRHDGHGHSHRERASDLGQSLGHELPVAVDVGVGVEDDRDDRQPLDGRRPEPRQARRAVDRVLDGLRDQQLHLFGRQARRFRLHRHLRRGELGKHVVLGVRDGDHAIHEQDNRQRQDDPAKPDRESDDGVQQAAVHRQSSSP